MAIRLQKVDYKPSLIEGFCLKRKFPFFGKKKFPNFGKEMELAHLYCKGVGIELGAAAHNAFNLPGAINVAPFSDSLESVDHKDFLLYKNEQVRFCGHYALVDIIGEADKTGIKDCSQDYVLSSHVVEHLPNLISAFIEWKRILKPGGIVFMIFPKRDAAEADKIRPITTIQHFVDDYNEKSTILTHPVDPGHYVRGHYHVFELKSMISLIDWCNENLKLNWRIECVEEEDSKVGNGHTVIAKQM